jgi:hypothetical protein
MRARSACNDQQFLQIKISALRDVRLAAALSWLEVSFLALGGILFTEDSFRSLAKIAIT